MALAVITGASSGIGREFAKQLRDTYGVTKFWFVARRTDRLEALRDELGVEAKIVSADLTKSEGIAAVTAALEEEKPQIDVFISAAGFGKFGSYAELSPETVSDMIDLNVKATVLLTHAVIPYMNRGGRIIEMGSASCFTPLPNFNIYASSKAFVLHYTKALNFEIAPLGLRATCFCPGWVNTEFLPLAMATPGVHVPKATKPLLETPDVVRRALRASRRGKTMCVTNWYTKLQHLLFKLLPDRILTKTWMKMQKVNPKSDEQ